MSSGRRDGTLHPLPTRDARVLDHIALYGLSVRVILARLFFAGRSPANVLQRLCTTGRLQARGLRGGPLRYYQLSPTEAARRGLPHRALPMGTRALTEALAVLWFCVADEPRRYRLERPELTSLLGATPPHGPHVLEPGDPARVTRCYVPGPQTRPAVVVKTLTRAIDATQGVPGLASWVGHRLYGFAVLTDAPPRQELLARALTRAALPAAVRVAYAPAPHSLADALRTLAVR